jgi:hypothetical protein
MRADGVDGRADRRLSVDGEIIQDDHIPWP